MIPTQNTVDAILLQQTAKLLQHTQQVSEESFKLMLSDALQELPVVVTVEPQQPQNKAEGETKGKDTQKEQEPEKVEPVPEEEPQPELAMAVIPVQVQPMPDEAEATIVVPALATSEAPQVQAVESQQVVAVATPEPEQPQAVVEQPAQVQAEPDQELPEVPIVAAELIVHEEARPHAVQTQVPTATEQPDAEEMPSRFETMVRTATQALLGEEEMNEQSVRVVAPETVQQPEAVETHTEPVATEPVAVQETQQFARREDEETADIAAAEPVPQANEEEPVRFTPITRENSFFATQAEQVEAKIVENIEHQNMEFRMQLQPQELGRVDVRMVLENGKLAVEIVAASSKAVEALREQTAGLMASMRLADIQLESVQVVQGTQSQEGYMHGAFDMAGGNSRPGDGQSASANGTQAMAEEQQAEAGEILIQPEQLLNTVV